MHAYLSGERDEMVFTQAGYVDIPYDYHFIVIFRKDSIIDDIFKTGLLSFAFELGRAIHQLIFLHTLSSSTSALVHIVLVFLKVLHDLDLLRCILVLFEQLQPSSFPSSVVLPR